MLRRPIWIISIVVLAVLVLAAAIVLLPLVGAVLAFVVSVGLAIRGAARGSRRSGWIAILLVALVGSIVWILVETAIQSRALEADPGGQIRATLWLALIAFTGLVVSLAVMLSLLLHRWTGQRVLSWVVPTFTGASVFLFVTVLSFSSLQVSMADAAAAADRSPTVNLSWLVTLVGIPIAVVFGIGAFVAGVILLGRWGRTAALRLMPRRD